MTIMLDKSQLAEVPANQDPRWQALVTRDRASDGKFVYSVNSTGVYCRPSCPARLAKPANVQFHSTAADAERAGLRACKRCKPDQVPTRDIKFAVGKCSLGSILVARSTRGICAILLGDDPVALARDLRDRFPQARVIGGDAAFEKLVAKAMGFVEVPSKRLDLPLDLRGTAFQRRVWQALRQIPTGSTASYADIASRIGSPKAVRAVAQACAANPIAVAIPCHRVVRHDGALSGYRWGIARKRALLARERGT